MLKTLWNTYAELLLISVVSILNLNCTIEVDSVDYMNIKREAVEMGLFRVHIQLTNTSKQDQFLSE